MSAEARLREDICWFARSLFERGLTAGSSGNISARLPDGGLLVTPTGACFGRLDPARLARLGPDLAAPRRRPADQGDAAARRLPRDASGTGAVVHLHSAHSVALSMLPGPTRTTHPTADRLIR